jgi:hypothetical protein
MKGQLASPSTSVFVQSGRFASVAEIVLGIAAHQLAFVASNGPLDFRRSFAGFNLELSNCDLPSIILRGAIIISTVWIA